MTAVLTPEQIEQFNTEGYVTPVRIMDVAEAETLRSKLEATEAARGGKLAPTERSKAHMLFKWLDDLIRDPRVLDPIEQLIGPNILCWNTLFWIKEAQSPSFVSWHQDTKYWGLSSDRVITAWLALSGFLDAGCMRVMPRTHIGDVLPHDDQYHQDNLLTRGQQITRGRRRCGGHLYAASSRRDVIAQLSACPCVRTQQYGRQAYWRIYALYADRDGSDCRKLG